MNLLDRAAHNLALCTENGEGRFMWRYRNTYDALAAAERVIGAPAIAENEWCGYVLSLFGEEP